MHGSLRTDCAPVIVLASSCLLHLRLYGRQRHHLLSTRQGHPTRSGKQSAAPKARLQSCGPVRRVQGGNRRGRNRRRVRALQRSSPTTSTPRARKGTQPKGRGRWQHPRPAGDTHSNSMFPKDIRESVGSGLVVGVERSRARRRGHSSGSMPEECPFPLAGRKGSMPAVARTDRQPVLYGCAIHIAHLIAQAISTLYTRHVTVYCRKTSTRFVPRTLFRGTCSCITFD